MTKYKFSNQLVEGLIKSRPNRFIMMVEFNGSIFRCHCPVTGRIGHLKFDFDVPCLLSPATTKNRKTPYTVEAISLDPIDKANKNWIGINQTKSNHYVDFLLQTAQLTKMVGQVENIRREVKLGNSRIDFLLNGRDYLEVKTLIMRMPTIDETSSYIHHQSTPQGFDRLIKHFNDVASSISNGSRAFFLLCHYYDADRFEPPMPNQHTIAVHEAATSATARGLENWQLNLKIDRDGVELIRVFKLLF